LLAATAADPNLLLTAEIVSCSGWKLNKLPQLKSFLKDGEAEAYTGVTVRYVPGRTAIMDIYKGGTLLEQVPLHTLQTKPEMHALMKEKGFVMKSPEELEAWKKRDKTDRELNAGAFARTKERKEKQRTVETRMERLVKEREKTKQRIQEEREYLGMSSSMLPSYATLFSLYGIVAAGVLCFSCSRSRRRWKENCNHEHDRPRAAHHPRAAK
jgi:nitrate reductase alpha subunit